MRAYDSLKTVFFFQNFELFGYWLNLPDLSLPYSDKTFLVLAHTCSPQREQLLSQAEGRKTAWKITGLITETSEHKCSRHDHKVKAYLSELFHSLFLLRNFVQSCGLLVNECLQSTLTHLTYLSWSFACWIAATRSKRHVKWLDVTDASRRAFSIKWKLILKNHLQSCVIGNCILPLLRT